MEFFTWEMAATAAGAALIVTAIAQFIKGFTLPVSPNVMRLIVYAVSVAILNAGAFFTKQWTVNTLGISFLNAILLTFAAMGEYEVLKTAGVYKSSETLMAMRSASK